MKVGFVGLGVMGRPMAGHLIAAGHEVAVWARRPESTAPLAEAGARVHATPAELARHCEVVISVVTASADVEHLALGSDGLIDGLAEGAIHVDMSTIAPETARKVAARYAEMGIGWLDAPVSGGEVGARDATLAIMAGGDAAVLERVRPLFACLGKTVVHNSRCPQLAADLRKHGYESIEVELDEFLKAGGSAKCLTLRLDGEEAASWRQKLG